MPATKLDGISQIQAGSITRGDLNTTLTGSAVIAKIISGTSISITSTGVDAGTGDVTINVGTILAANGGTGVANPTGASLTLSGNSLTLTTTGATNVTLPTSGTLAALNTAQSFTATQSFPGSTTTIGVITTNIGEVTTVSATAATGTINYYLNSQSILYYTTAASANWTLNVAFSSGTTLNTAMSIGQCMTFAFLVTQGTTAFYQTAMEIDGTSVTPVWQGGAAPTSGNASGIDVYSFSIIKTAASTYTVLAAQVKY